jgi:hypothetical protein
MSTVLILGNGKSRLEKQDKIKAWNGDLYICNLAFREWQFLPKITAVGTVHSWILPECIQCKNDNNLDYEILVPENTTNDNPNTHNFISYKGYSTGSEMIRQAVTKGYDEIYLSGFAIQGDETDIYTYPLYTQNFILQIGYILEEFPNLKLKYL